MPTRAASSPGDGLGWRRRALVVLALLGCVGLFTLLRTLSGSPHIDAGWRINANGQMVLDSVWRRCTARSRGRNPARRDDRRWPILAA